MVASPRDKEGRILISGHIRNDKGIMGSVQVSVVILPHQTTAAGVVVTSDSVRSPTTKKRSTIEDKDSSTSGAILPNEFIGKLHVRVITAMDLSRLVGAISIAGTMGEWSAVTKVCY